MDPRPISRTGAGPGMAFVLACVLCLAVFAPAANAADGSTGLGFIIGEPTGISFKKWISGENAIGAAAAWSFADGGAAHVHVDYLWHFFDRVEGTENFTVPLYIGVGGRVKFDEDDSLIGARVPLGLIYLFNDAPFDFFLEVVPILDVAPDSDVRLNAALGVRYFFD